jgi:hypothetical protein
MQEHDVDIREKALFAPPVTADCDDGEAIGELGGEALRHRSVERIAQREAGVGAAVSNPVAPQ